MSKRVVEGVSPGKGTVPTTPPEKRGAVAGQGRVPTKPPAPPASGGKKRK